MVLLNPILHPIPTRFNRVQIRRIWWLFEYSDSSLLQILPCFESSMSRGTILHENKTLIRIFMGRTNPSIDDWNYMLTVGVSIDSSPILFPEDPWSFPRSREATLEHPASLSLMSFDNTGRVPLLAWPPSNEDSSMRATRDPGFISPENLTPLLRGPVNMLSCPG